MRSLFLLVTVLISTLGLAQTASAANAHSLLPASASLDSVSLESINLGSIPVSPAQTKAENCDMGDNPQVCDTTGSKRAVVLVEVGYRNEYSEQVGVTLTLPVQAFTKNQIRAIEQGARAETLVKLSLRSTLRAVSTPDYRNCNQGDAPGASFCSGPILRQRSMVKAVEVSISVRR